MRVDADAAYGRRLSPLVSAPCLILAASFSLSRVGYRLAGIRYDDSFLPIAFQHLDVAELEHNLLESVWYQHTQPPLFNLFLGLVLKLSPFRAGLTFHVLWLLLGAALVVLVYRLLLALRVRRGLAIAATIVITCSPTVVLYENWLSYEYPLTVALTAIALASVRWVAAGEQRWLVAVAALGGACLLTRVLLNPIWYVGVVAIVLVARRPDAGRTAAGVVLALPLILVGAVALKNQVVFGEPTLSSWSGWNLQRVTIDELPDDTRARLVADGTLTPLADYGVFLPIDSYRGYAGECVPEHENVPVLADPTKSGGAENFNNECYLPITSEAQRNAIAAARAEPGAAAKAVVGSFQIWAESPSQYAFVYDNRLQIDRIDELYRRAVLLDVPWDPPVEVRSAWWIPLGTPGGQWRVTLTVVVATLIAVGAGVRSGWRIARGRGSPLDVGLAVIGFTVLAVTLVGNLFEIGENNRFRFMVEPVTLVALAWFVDRVYSRVTSRLSRSTRGLEPARSG